MRNFFLDCSKKMRAQNKKKRLQNFEKGLKDLFNAKIKFKAKKVGKLTQKKRSIVSKHES